VHFGNFRDVITSYAVSQALREKGLKSRAIFSWDNYDRFRKVPANVPAEYIKYIGMPLSAIPSPEPGFSSYAEYFQKPFEAAMRELDIQLEYRYQTEEYKSGKYDKQIIFALQNRKNIAKILLSLMTAKGKENAKIDEAEYIEDYYPISVYSRFSGKDATKVTAYDGESTITYTCIETGKTESVDLKVDRIAKLSWKVDWAMRWGIENVVFEPGGHDHASPGSSYDVSSMISKQFFGREEPIFVEYKFVGIQGGGVKMSGSKGNAVSPKDLLEIYEPELLKWIYMRRRPDQPFSLAFDTEIYRQYDEFDREVKKYEHPIPFKQAVALGQITLWNEDKVLKIVEDLGENYNIESVKARLPKAKNWLDKYNPEEAIKLRDEVNSKYASAMDDSSREQVSKLASELKGELNSIKDLELLVYSIPKDPALTDKENAPAQKEFFRHIYNLLISRDRGPRLSTFLWAADRGHILKLLQIQ
jgi:lysyl-tRNA synthetase, class I